MHKLTRISYNTADWRHPTSDASRLEANGTYNQQNGFGHEDWLFRSEWLIDGWRYAFLQGVNKGRAGLVKAAEPIDISLYVIKPGGVRSLVATLYDVECLNDQQAEGAVGAFREAGWYDKMQREIEAVGGNVSALTDTRWTPEVLNIRFRLDNVTRYPADNILPAGEWTKRFTRYQLQDIEDVDQEVKDKVFRGRRGSKQPPSTVPYSRRPVGPTECTPEHARMQKKLLEELRKDYPGAKVEHEKDFIDISVITDTECLLFELKSDLDPRTVIRLALGQILEYAYHPSRSYNVPVKLFIVGRRPLSSEDDAYLKTLQQKFGLPVDYRVVSL